MLIVNQIYRWAQIQPQKAAFIFDDVSISYAAFSRLLDISQRFFQGQKLSSETTAIVLINHVPDAWFITLALRALGVTTICVRSLSQAAELNIRDASCVVVTQSELQLHSLTREMLSGRKLITVLSALYAGLETGDIPAPLAKTLPSGDHILFTSGTTGTFKKVLWDSGREEQNLERLAQFRSHDRNTVYHGLNHGLWSMLGLNGPLTVWRVGGTVIFDQRPERFQRYFQHGVNRGVLVPSWLRQLIEVRQYATIPSPGFQLMLGGGLMPRPLLQTALQRLTRRIANVYVSTECEAMAASSYEMPEDFAWLEPYGGRVVEIVDDTGMACSTGQEGRLRVRLLEGDAHGYLDDENASAKIFQDGYFYSGDIAVFRSDGRFKIAGRAEDVLVIQGTKIAAGPLEQDLQQILNVDSVCVFSGLNREGIDEIVVAVEAINKPPPGSLEAAARTLAGFERVRFEFFDAFPRTATGLLKVRRGALRSLVMDASKTSPELNE